MVKRNQESVLAQREERKMSRGKQVAPKFEEAREESVNARPLVAMNEKQGHYIELLNTKDMVVATGLPGTSKTYIPTVMACDLFRANKIKRIIFTRPNISNSASLGMFKGTVEEKMAPWLAPVLSILKERLGKGALEIALKNEDITFLPLETIKGLSAEKCWFIVDEAEDLSRDEAKKVVTRQGKDCKMILCGDLNQSELSGDSGLKMLSDMVKRYSFLDVGFVEFDKVNDIVRSKQCKDWTIAFRKEEGFDTKE